MESPDNENKERRQFIKNSVITAAGAIAGSTLLSSCDSKEPKKTVKLLSQDGKIVEVDSEYIDPQIPEFLTYEHSIREGIPGRKFVMLIDLSRCKNAGKCKEACSKMHYLPEDRSFIKINKMQDSDKASPYWMPISCFHCDNPPCTKVCPVDATFKLSDGIVSIDNDRCIGCRFCMVACPYSARVFNWGDEMMEMTKKEFENITPHKACSDHKIGTVEKCDFCPGKAREGVLPDCVSACPNGVFYFGDENEDTITNGDETVKLSKILKDKAGFRYLEELGTKPRVYYLPPVDRLFPFKEKKVEENKI